MVRHALVAVILGWSSGALAQETAGRVVVVRGDVTVVTQAGSAPARVGDVLTEGAQIRTGTRSAVRLLLDQSTVLDLGADTSLVLNKNRAEPKRRSTSLKLFTGKMWARVTSWLGGEREFVVESPNAVAGVRGTEFVMDVTPAGETAIVVFDGSVAARAADSAQEQLIGAGMRGFAGASGGVQVSQASAEDLQLRGQTSAGGRLSTMKEGQRFQSVSNVLKGAPAQAPQSPSSPADALELLVPPLELDPATTETRLRGRIEVQP